MYLKEKIITQSKSISLKNKCRYLDESYLTKSVKQILLGNYADETTALGTAGQIALGLTGLDVAADVRDLVYDITHWKNDWSHLGQTLLDGVGLIPLVGALKNIDEAADLLKHGNDVVESVGDAAKRTDDVVESVSKTSKTIPTKSPNPTAVPKGSRTKISSNDDSETIRALTRENESADILSKKGYDIEQNPKIGGPKNPDYKIGENVFDNYAPSANTKPRNIWAEVAKKIKKAQTERVIINTSDWQGNIDDLIKQFEDWTIEGLKEILVIDKNGNIFNVLN